MTSPANLYVLMQRLGMAAITQATKTAQLAELRQRSDISDILLEREARKQLDQLLDASIAYTARLVVVCNLGTAENARELEEKLVTSLKGTGTLSPTFKQAVEDLAVAAATFATIMAALVKDSAAASRADLTKVGKSVPAREQTYRLAHAAIAFTMQLLVACSADEDAALISAMEVTIVARLDEMPWYEEDQ